MKTAEKQEIDRYHEQVREVHARGVFCGALITLALSLPPGPPEDSIDLEEDHPMSTPEDTNHAE
jgi:hypothetical protein